MLCDLSLYGGSMSVDKDLMDEAYGGVYGSNRDVLRGRVEVPAGLQPAMGGITAVRVEAERDVGWSWGGRG